MFRSWKSFRSILFESKIEWYVTRMTVRRPCWTDADYVQILAAWWRFARSRPERWLTNEDVAVHVGFTSDWKRRGSHWCVVYDAVFRRNSEIVSWFERTYYRLAMASMPKSEKHAGKWYLYYDLRWKRTNMMFCNNDGTRSPWSFFFPLSVKFLFVHKERTYHKKFS